MSDLSLRPNVFKNPDFDAVRFARELEEKKPAHRSFGIFFTPRSGSSWLTDVVIGTKLMGKPHEWFNPNFIPNITRGVNAETLDGYIEMIRRKHKPGGIFSFEITSYQLRRVFGMNGTFPGYFPPEDIYFYLTREDMVAQAVSLAKAVQTDVFHSKGSAPDAVQAADEAFPYDADLIEEWLDHIFGQEKLFETFFETHGYKPIRITYEQMTGMGAEGVAHYLMRTVRPGIAKKFTYEPTVIEHKKIGTSRNAEYVDRFRRDRAKRVAEVEAFRAGLTA
ncbi:MAG: Stf0 family sulfotransferase [Roseovarius sp.]